MDRFQPSKNEKTVISIRLETELLHKIDKISTDNKLSRNELITQCINYALESYLKK